MDIKEPVAFAVAMKMGRALGRDGLRFERAVCCR